MFLTICDLWCTCVCGDQRRSCSPSVKYLKKNVQFLRIQLIHRVLFFLDVVRLTRNIKASGRNIYKNMCKRRRRTYFDIIYGFIIFISLAIKGARQRRVHYILKCIYTILFIIISIRRHRYIYSSDINKFIQNDVGQIGRRILHIDNN